MRIHLLTIGEPKLKYAQDGWKEYTKRLGRFHQVRLSHVPDKQNNAEHILATAGTAYKIATVIYGPQMNSPQLADFLEHQAGQGRELCFMIGGPEGLPPEVITNSDKQLSMSELTFPHDLAMVILAEALYRASTIAAGHPYHRA